MRRQGGREAGRVRRQGGREAGMETDRRRNSLRLSVTGWGGRKTDQPVTQLKLLVE